MWPTVGAVTVSVDAPIAAPGASVRGDRQRARPMTETEYVLPVASAELVGELARDRAERVELRQRAVEKLTPPTLSVQTSPAAGMPESWHRVAARGHRRDERAAGDVVVDTEAGVEGRGGAADRRGRRRRAVGRR